jgi:nitrite reductase/ring-hydroxylating ferredoxin subunit
MEDFTKVPDFDIEDPPALKPELERPPLYVRDVLPHDIVPPPDNMYEDMNLTLGNEPIDASRYFSKEFFELERERLWPRVWQFACWGQDIPRAGDVHVYRILDRSVLLVRQRDGSVKALVNACLHRGRELCTEDDRVGELKCPFHFYTWNLDGSVKWIPSQWDFPTVTKENFRLPEIRVEEWNGFLFVNFDPEAPSLGEYMGQRFLDHWSVWDFSKRYKAVHVEKHIQCNWKVGQDAFIEAWHTFASHSQGLTAVPDECGQQDIYPDAPNMSRYLVLMGHPSFRLDPPPAPDRTFEQLCGYLYPEGLGTEEGVIKEGETIRDAVARIARLAYKSRWGIDASGYSTAEMLDAISYFVFPNFMPWSGYNYPLVYRFLPGKDPDWCVWETMLFHPFEGERPPSCEKIVLGPEDSFLDVPDLGGLALPLHQDAIHMPAVQRGMKNLKNGQLTLAEYEEVRIRHYHQRLTEFMGL